MVDHQVGALLDHELDLGENFLSALGNTSDEYEYETQGQFTWHIDDWSKLTEVKYESPRFTIGNFEWNLLLFPQGNHNKGLAVYLEPHPVINASPETGESGLSDPDWYVCAQFAVSLSKPGNDKEVHTMNRSHHRFSAFDTDWGFANLIELAHLRQYTKGRISGLLNDDKLNITAFIKIIKDPTGVLWHNFVNYDSKKVTGYVGFRNQGATCYLNSLLQSYFFTTIFRKIVYRIPTGNESPNNSVPLALQKSFYQLEISPYPLDTLELTRSFGWDSAEAFTQHDVQELNRILMDRLENRMKGTAVEGKLNDIFVGRMKSYVKCVDVDYESSKVEDFWDLQLNVKGMKDLKQSFDNYVEMELLNGENQYAAQGHGLQDAQKGVIFEKFPSVLHLQLKRFEYDFSYDQMIKVNDKYEFPESIDLRPYLDENALDELSSEDDAIFNLYMVLVHSGDISTGHYYTMIKPTLEDKWYRFDDEKVFQVSKKQALDENYGCERLPDDELRKLTRDEYQEYLLARHTNAYMLVYIKKTKQEEILSPTIQSDVPDHVVLRVNEENKLREQQEKDRREAHLYMRVICFSIRNFVNYEGFDICCTETNNFLCEELNDGEEQPVTIKLLRSSKMSDIYNEIKRILRIPLENPTNFWKMEYRRNSTLRAAKLIDTELNNFSLNQYLSSENEQSVTALSIFVEEPYFRLESLIKLHGNMDFDVWDINSKFIDHLRLNYHAVCNENGEELKLWDDDSYMKSTPSHVDSKLDVMENDRTKTNLLFIKIFDHKSQKIRGLTYTLASDLSDLTEISYKLGLLNGKNDPIVLYEELQPGNVEELSLDNKVYESELSTGDILCLEYQKPRSSGTPFLGPMLLQRYDFLRHRVKIRLFRSANYDKNDDLLPKFFTVWISSHSSYQELATLVAEHLNVDPNYLKISALYANGKFSLKSGSMLTDYLNRDYNSDQIPPFEFEVLSVPLIEAEHLRPFKLYWLKDSYIHYQIFEFEFANNTKVNDLLDKLQIKLGLSLEDKKNVLFWTNSNSKFTGLLSPESSFKDFDQHVLIFGRILPEESNLICHLDKHTHGKLYGLPSDKVISIESESTSSLPDNHDAPGKLVVVSQYFRDPERNHGISFLFNLIPDENFLETRNRLHEKFGLGDKEFGKVKFSLYIKTSEGALMISMEEYTDDELQRLILDNRMKNMDKIFMDHPDRLKSHAVGAEKPMMIKN